MLDPFQATVPYSYPLNTSENLWFYKVFRGYRNRTLVWNELISWMLYWIFYQQRQENNVSLHCLGVSLYSFILNTYSTAFDTILYCFAINYWHVIAYGIYFSQMIWQWPHRFQLQVIWNHQAFDEKWSIQVCSYAPQFM